VTSGAAVTLLQRQAATIVKAARVIGTVHITLSLLCGEQKRQNSGMRIQSNYEYHDGASEATIAQLKENAHAELIKRCRATGYTGPINVRDEEPTLRTSSGLPSVWVCQTYADIPDSLS
jgi:hypothetical protein